MIPPIDDTYTIYFNHNNGGKCYFNDILQFDNWSSSSTDSFIAIMKINQFYKVVAEFEDDHEGSNANLYWSYTGQTQTVIPSSSMIYLQYLSNIPLTLEVYPSCGNGVVTINEE